MLMPWGNMSPDYALSMIYHVVTSAEWALVSKGRHYSPPAFSNDGFIHCCKEEQLEYVGKCHFRGRQGLVVLCIDPTMVAAPIKYEDLTGENMLFPHIYGVLNTDAVKSVVAFQPRADGTFEIPAEIRG